MSYIPIHFALKELVPPGVTDIIVMDERILWTLDALRDYFGKPITVNTGTMTQRGFRNDPSVGAPYSQHRFGRAADFDIEGMPAEEFRKWAMADTKRHELQYVTRIELDTTWNHIDCANAHGITFFARETAGDKKQV